MMRSSVNPPAAVDHRLNRVAPPPPPPSPGVGTPGDGGGVGDDGSGGGHKGKDNNKDDFETRRRLSSLGSSGSDSGEGHNAKTGNSISHTIAPSTALPSSKSADINISGHHRPAIMSESPSPSPSSPSSMTPRPSHRQQAHTSSFPPLKPSPSSSPTTYTTNVTFQPSSSNTSDLPDNSNTAASTDRPQQQKPEEQPRVFCVEDDDRLSVTQVMVCGGLAGITEHAAMYPVDTIKTRMQSYVAIRELPAQWTMYETTRAIVRREGLGSLWRGISAVLLSAGPAHAVYFATYEGVSKRLNTSLNKGGGMESNYNSNDEAVNPLVTSVAGGCATIVGDGIMTPLDVVKQRMQLVKYGNIWNCISHVYNNHGVRAFYAGYKATLLMNIPFTAVYFTGYETAKRMLLKYQGKDKDTNQFSVSSHCLAGASAGAAAAAITNPLDVVKTRLQTQGEIGARRYRGLTDALESIRVEEGMRGLLRGMRARVLFHMPAAAVCWTTYEFCKHVMRRTGQL